MSKIITWLKDEEKILIPILVIAIALIWFLPEMFYKGAVTLFLFYKIWEIATDKSTNSLVKDIKASTTAVTMPQSSTPAT